MDWLRVFCDGRSMSVLVLSHMMLVCSISFALSLAPTTAAHAEEGGGKSVFDTVIIRNRTPEGSVSSQKPDGKSSEDPIKENSVAVEQQTRKPASSSTSKHTKESGKETGGKSGAAADGSAGGKAGGRLPGTSSEKPLVAAAVREAKVSTDGGKTRFQMSLSAGVRAEIFTLANPYRVIIDLPDVEFDLPDSAGHKAGGLISAFRYGLFADNKGRVVIDTTGPVRIDGAKMMSVARGRSVSLEMELVSISEAEFGVGTGTAANAAATAAQPTPKPAIFDDPLGSPSEEKKKPLILIDPGHGGIDPGAVGVNSLLEKAVVLDVAKRIERRLTATGKFRVALTRDRDVFLSLDQRVKMLSDLGADLFVSLHADSLESKSVASHVRGATVYTLSERASDEQARRMAEKENSSDQAAGIDSGAMQVDNEEVRNILFDLMKRETSNFSTDFSNLLVSRLKQSVSVSREPQRAAAFRVLKQNQAPSVLVELGYLSNDDDAKLMRQSEWQGKVAQSIVAAIDAFFDKRTARTGR